MTMDTRSNLAAPDLALIQQLRSRREQMGVSQTEIAKMLTASGVRMSQTAISRIEKYERALTVGEAQLYASLLGTTLEEVLRNDPVDELIAHTRAQLRSADVTRRSAAASLRAHCASLEELESQLNELSTALEDAQVGSDPYERMLAAKESLLEQAYDSGFLNEEVNKRLAAAMDDLELTTANTAALKRAQEMIN